MLCMSESLTINRVVTGCLNILDMGMTINFADEVHYVWQDIKTCLKWTYLFILHFPILRTDVQYKRPSAPQLRPLHRFTLFTGPSSRSSPLTRISRALTVGTGSSTRQLQSRPLLSQSRLFSSSVLMPCITKLKYMLYFLAFFIVPEVIVMLTALCHSEDESCLMIDIDALLARLLDSYRLLRLPHVFNIGFQI
ncbi:hypothetical protein NEOLEDRAFT_884959 [Neolentinus lepideus HHB14362 ss-1]|uniref:Uncharacterized protein n=1 Tax=Neolentinus lepideus HHB14362 ss-1 TaxID=1314782 RepID=A0A165NW72_9AGAM|nr:hypothetical protein NEOLEDRAFT_884959 [Neolentinus lepideus HHB14362 ss-1]